MFLLDSFRKYVTRKKFAKMKINFDDYMTIDFKHEGYPEILRDLLFYMARVYLPFEPDTFTKPRKSKISKNVTTREAIASQGDTVS